MFTHTQNKVRRISSMILAQQGDQSLLRFIVYLAET